MYLIMCSLTEVSEVATWGGEKATDAGIGLGAPSTVVKVTGVDIAHVHDTDETVICALKENTVHNVHVLDATAKENNSPAGTVD